MKKSIRLKVILLGITIGIIIILIMQIRAYNIYADSIQNSKELKLISKDVIYYDEVLTMSTYMAVYTGEQ